MSGIEEEKPESAFNACERVKSDSELIEDLVGSVSVLDQAALSYAAKGWPVFTLPTLMSLARIVVRTAAASA
jgi:hypothetical protein